MGSEGGPRGGGAGLEKGSRDREPKQEAQEIQSLSPQSRGLTAADFFLLFS